MSDYYCAPSYTHEMFDAETGKVFQSIRLSRSAAHEDAERLSTQFPKNVVRVRNEVQEVVATYRNGRCYRGM